jgi:hypothetical protein
LEVNVNDKRMDGGGFIGNIDCPDQKGCVHSVVFRRAIVEVVQGDGSVKAAVSLANNLHPALLGQAGCAMTVNTRVLVEPGYSLLAPNGRNELFFSGFQDDGKYLAKPETKTAHDRRLVCKPHVAQQ